MGNQQAPAQQPDMMSQDALQALKQKLLAQKAA
jgi:hypothetical protein